jgi:selenocysteine lyase/cysteine desulfurase
LDTAARGGTVAFNFLTPSGEVVDERLVELEAAAAGLSLRTGCFCNPGAGEAAFTVTADSARGVQGSQSLTIDQYLGQLRLPSGGAIRVSLGIASTLDDVQRFLDFAERTYVDRSSGEVDLPPRRRC